MINPLKARKLINKLYGGLCPSCRAKLSRYTQQHKDKVKGQDFWGINNDMSDMPICETCKTKLRKLMEGFKGDMGMA